MFTNYAATSANSKRCSRKHSRLVVDRPASRDQYKHGIPRRGTSASKFLARSFIKRIEAVCESAALIEEIAGQHAVEPLRLKSDI